MLASTMISSVFVMTMVLVVGHARTTTAPTCGVNEKEVDCAPDTACQATCDQPAGRLCPRRCSLIPCVCEKDFIRASINNETCIEKTQCDEPRIRLSITCGENEKYTRCAKSCQPSCEQPDQEPCPTSECVGKCVCKKGYFRATNNITSSCVTCAE